MANVSDNVNKRKSFVSGHVKLFSFRKTHWPNNGDGGSLVYHYFRVSEKEIFRVCFAIENCFGYFKTRCDVCTQSFNETTGHENRTRHKEDFVLHLERSSRPKASLTFAPGLSTHLAMNDFQINKLRQTICLFIFTRRNGNVFQCWTITRIVKSLVKSNGLKPNYFNSLDTVPSKKQVAHVKRFSLIRFTVIVIREGVDEKSLQFGKQDTI